MKDLKKNRQIPVARKNDIVVQELPGETLVYDLRQHKAHCLNETSAFVWNHCDGETDAARIAALLSKEFHRAIDEDVVWLALKQLQRAGLLEGEVVAPGAMPSVSRREVVRRLGAATALALPLVTSVVAPTAVQAQSRFIPAECQACVKKVDKNGVLECPTVCTSTVIGTCYGNAGCGSGQGITCQSCGQCSGSGLNNSWEAPGDLNC